MYSVLFYRFQKQVNSLNKISLKIINVENITNKNSFEWFTTKYYQTLKADKCLQQNKKNICNIIKSGFYSPIKQQIVVLFQSNDL